jgi:MFS family permease
MRGTAVVMLTGMVPYERRHPQPTLDLRLFRSRLFAAASASLTLSFLALFAVSFMLPFYFERLRGFDAETSGLLLTPLPLMIAIFAPMSGALADRVGTRWLSSLGMTISCTGLVLLSQIGTESSMADIVWRLMVIGFGQALFQSPNNSALMGAVPPDRVGIASGVLGTGRVVGQSLSVALAGAVFTGTGGAEAAHALHRLGTSDPARLIALQEQFIRAFRATLLTCALVAAIGVFTSLIRGPEVRESARVETSPAPADDFSSRAF